MSKDLTNTLLLSLLFITVQGNKYQQLRLKKVQNDFVTLFKPIISLKKGRVTTLLECAANCVERICSAFYFDKQLLLCTLGKCAISHHLQLPGKSYIYQSNQIKCTDQPDFRIETRGNTSSCLWWSKFSENFSNANNACLALGATMVTVRSLEKLHILSEKISLRSSSQGTSIYPSYQSVYIGLSYIKGAFRWHDDGSAIDPEYMNQTFAAGELSKNITNGCVVIGNITSFFQIVECNVSAHYVCEITCFDF